MVYVSVVGIIGAVAIVAIVFGSGFAGQVGPSGARVRVTRGRRS